jgi:hypothetical protein
MVLAGALTAFAAIPANATPDGAVGAEPAPVTDWWQPAPRPPVAPLPEIVIDLRDAESISVEVVARDEARAALDAYFAAEAGEGGAASDAVELQRAASNSGVSPSSSSQPRSTRQQQTVARSSRSVRHSRCRGSGRRRRPAPGQRSRLWRRRSRPANAPPSVARTASPRRSPAPCPKATRPSPAVTAHRSTHQRRPRRQTPSPARRLLHIDPADDSVDHMSATSHPRTRSVRSRALSSGALSAAVSQAKSEWASLGADTSGISGLGRVVSDLTLGAAYGSHIAIDDDAAGWGWSRMDLLTVVRHEIGHALGFGHTGSGPHGGHALPREVPLRPLRRPWNPGWLRPSILPRRRLRA